MSDDDVQLLDTADLEDRVKAMYELVALEPDQTFHFETGRPLAERLGYPNADLDVIPGEAIDSFAGVGYFLDLAALQPGETVLDLGSGSGTDSFLAAVAVGQSGRVIGVDMTPAQLAKSGRLAESAGYDWVSFVDGYIERPPVADASVDCVISNGVINLSPDKPSVFRSAASALRPGGRFAVADIITEVRLPDGVTCNASLWAACIGGAAPRDEYVQMCEDAGLGIETIRSNDYQFISDQALGASTSYGVASVSILARRS